MNDGADAVPQREAETEGTRPSKPTQNGAAGAEAMRVLLWMVPEGVSVPGGHLVAMEQTVQALRVLGVDAVSSFEERPSLGSFDLVHGFGLVPAQIRSIRQQGKPVALSTIYCSPRYLQGAPPATSWAAVRRLSGRSRAGLALLAASIAGTVSDKCNEVTSAQRELALAYESADVLLPNSVRQGEHLSAELSTTTPWQYVPYAMNHQLLTSFDVPRRPFADRDIVLYVGRFEPRKNQLGLIRALRGTTYPVVLAGPKHPDHPAYWDRCRREASSNVTVLPRQRLVDLVGLYSRARVHVLPSWGETTGLVSLEAAMMGSNIVVSTEGYADEYFKELAWYCKPDNPRSIRSAVDEAYRGSWREELPAQILSTYTWDKTADATLRGYRMIID